MDYFASEVVSRAMGSYMMTEPRGKRRMNGYGMSMLKQVAPSRPSMRPHEVVRAIADLRRGDAVVLHTADAAVLVHAAEAIDDEALTTAKSFSRGAPVLATTRRRAVALDLLPADGTGSRAVELRLPTDVSADFLHELADPTIARQVRDLPVAVTDAAASGLAAAAIELAKLARLLPAAVLFPMTVPAAMALALEAGMMDLGAAQVFHHRSELAHSLRRVADARVPLVDAEQARVIAFRPDDGGTDHLAIMIGTPTPGEPVLARIHSECFTGDLLGSLRCDCGDQLRGAIRAIAEAGSGVLIYLAQEGRGIGLVNKLRAYTLQDSGFDTVDANLQLGFDADERVYQPAAEMLRQLGFSRVQLMTNNPEKVAALSQHGIEVTERVPHAFPSNDHNRAYLATKASRSGHLF
jgi:GTP cyclohydrolase II